MRDGELARRDWSFPAAPSGGGGGPDVKARELLWRPMGRWLDLLPRDKRPLSSRADAEKERSTVRKEVACLPTRNATGTAILGESLWVFSYFHLKSEMRVL